MMPRFVCFVISLTASSEIIFYQCFDTPGFDGLDAGQMRTGGRLAVDCLVLRHPRYGMDPIGRVTLPALAV
jgi:hypothetical protein